MLLSHSLLYSCEVPHYFYPFQYKSWNVLTSWHGQYECLVTKGFWNWDCHEISKLHNYEDPRFPP